MIDPLADRAVYKQLADLYHRQIVAGELAVGTRLPSESSLAHEHRLGRETVRKAIAILRNEGLVTTVQGEGTLVRCPTPSREIQLAKDEWASIRIPHDDERQRLGLPEGVPVVEVHRAAGKVEVVIGDSARIVRA